jgi:hypothetical protein
MILKIPENINQFDKPGYYKLSMVSNEFINKYCIYCGDLYCPCDKFMNNKRLFEDREKEANEYGEPSFKRSKINN